MNPHDAKPTLTPKLRFPEFQGHPGWDRKVLSTIADPLTGKAEAGDGSKFLTLSGENGIVLQSEYFGKQVAGQNSERYTKIARDDFVYNDRTTKQAVYGTIKRLTDHDGGIVSPIYKCFRFGPGEDPRFWDFYFEAGIHDAELSELVNEGARAGRFNISIHRFLSTSAWRALNAEQQKIAACLTSLDEVIAAQSRKLAALSAHKRGLMQQLFPREGQTLPRLRFPVFRDAEWGSVTLGEVVEVASGQVDPTEAPYCDLPQVGSENIESDTGKLRNLKSARVKGVISGNYLFDENDVLYSKIRPALNKVAAPQIKGICSADIYPIRPASGELLRNYLFYLLLSEEFLGYAIMNSARGKIPKINRDALLAYKAMIPPLPEQHRIAACLSALDARLAAESQKLAALKTHKKALMQQLFPSPEGD